MRIKKHMHVIGILVALIFSLISLPGAYADDYSRGRGRGHDRDDRGYRGGHDYYRSHRYYPRNFFFYRRYFYLPQRRYYFFYDYYPEKRYYYESERNIYPSRPEYLPITSIANMASQGVPDSVIIDEIRRTGSVYKLSMESITYLKHNNVSDSVIDVMIDSSRK